MLELLREYMLLRQLVTPAVFVFWSASKTYGSKLLSTMFILAFSIVLLASYPKTYVSQLWVIYSLIIFGYGSIVSGDHVFAACYAALSAHFGGWLYEVPFWHPASMFASLRYPWLVNTQIISGLFCVYLLAVKQVKANKTMLLVAMCYAALSLFYILKPPHGGFNGVPLWWLPRVGVMFLLWSALTGIVGEEKK